MTNRIIHTNTLKIIPLFFVTVILILVPVSFTLAQSGGIATSSDSTGAVPATATSTPRTVLSATGTSAQIQPIPPRPTGQTVPVAPTTPSPVTTTTPAENSNQSPIQIAPLYTTPPSSGNSFPAVLLWAIAACVLAAGYGIFRLMRASGNNAKKNETNDRCSGIKQQLEQKKKELGITQKNFSLQQAALDAMKKKIDRKKDEIKGKLKDKAEEKIKDAISLDEESKLGRAVNLAESAKETYDDLQEKYEQALKIKQALETQMTKLTGEVRTLESAYNACVKGVPVSEIATTGGLEIDLPDFARRNKIKALIFDAEGVIIDTEHSVWKPADTEFLRRRGFPYPDELRAKIIGTTMTEGVQIMKDFFGFSGDTEALSKERIEIAHQFFQKNVSLVKGFREFYNQHRDLPMAIATSLKPEYLQPVIDSLSLKKYFKEDIYSIYAVGARSKPNPDIFLYAASKLGVKPEYCVVLEDAPNGIEAARRAGMRSIALTTTFPRDYFDNATVVVDNYEKIDLRYLEDRPLPKA